MNIECGCGRVAGGTNGAVKVTGLHPLGATLYSAELGLVETIVEQLTGAGVTVETALQCAGCASDALERCAANGFRMPGVGLLCTSTGGFVLIHESAIAAAATYRNAGGR